MMGLRGKKTLSNTLVSKFSLNTRSLNELYFIPKLNQIQQTLNCWSLSLIGKVTVIKSHLLPQLLYLLSVLCISIPKSFFKKRKINIVFFKFTWSGGNDRVKRPFLQ